MKFILILLLLFEMKLNQENEQIDPVPEQISVEFIASYDKEPYLAALEENEKNYLDLFNLQKDLQTSDFSNDSSVSMYCPRNFYSSFDLSSYLIPVQKPVQITECPNMKQTCCYQKSLQELSELWDNKYKPYLEYNYEYFRYYLVQIMSKHRTIQRAAKKVLKSDKNHNCTNVAKKILDSKFDQDDLTILKRAINNLKEFDFKLKKNFMCFMCDYESIKHIHLNDKIVTFDLPICEKIVRNTYQEYYYLNDFIYKYLNTANFLTYCINNENLLDFGNINLQKGAQIEYLDIDNSLTNQQCKYALDGNYNIVANCFHYCSNFNFWYFGQPIFRNIHKLAAIFENLNDKIFKGKLPFKIEKPQLTKNMLPIFDVQSNAFNLFDYFHYVFKEKDGIKNEVLFDQ